MEFLGFDLIKLIETVGLVGIVAIVFAETGLLFGFIFPGDSLLFTAGFLASRDFFNPWLVATLCFIAAVLGNFVGYDFGKRIGKRLFNKEESFWFHKDHLTRAENFYKKHGAKTIVLARFMPVVRVFAPIVAGMGRMEYKKFIFYNIFGGAVWTYGLTFAGFFLGNAVPDIDKYLLPIIGFIIFVSFIPTVVEFIRHKKSEPV